MPAAGHETADEPATTPQSPPPSSALAPLSETTRPDPEAPTVIAFASPGAASNRTVEDPAACVTVAATDPAGVASAIAAAAMHGAAIRLRQRPSISTTFPSAPMACGSPSLQEPGAYSRVTFQWTVHQHTIRLC